MHYVLAPHDEEFLAVLVEPDFQSGTLTTLHNHTIPAHEFPGWVHTQEREHHPRWVWADSATTYRTLLAHGIRVEKCWDLRKARAILKNAAWVDPTAFMSGTNLAETTLWNGPAPEPTDGLFPSTPHVAIDPVAEFQRQLHVLNTAEPHLRGRLQFLIAAESAGTLTAAEMTHAGVPWNRDIHNDILTAVLGPRPQPGFRPHALEDLARTLRSILDAPNLNPDSPRELLKTLQRAGLKINSTNKWEIRDIDHPVIPPLLEYKKLSRMLSANGWTWMDEWIKNGRFRPIYVPGGAATGRWGADGGGALQLPHFVRPAIVADEGWTFVIADAAQLEPRILAAMSHDHAMAQAGRGHDMYQEIVNARVVESREHAKYGMLGAMYGGTTGVSAQVLPKFKIAFPRAMALVENAARAGEQGRTVHTWLGRTSLPGVFEQTGEGDDPTSTRDRMARARSYGRFTRNFICQGTAAEWALCWMAQVRQDLWQLTLREAETTATVDARVEQGPHLVFFLHDEILIHTPTHLAQQVAELVTKAAQRAGTLLFGDSDVEFPVTAAINTSYTNPKT
ncbi:bifunctional 3'-5' exonuclease/DNA polymerase [Timonella sp. A28]|uniref:bifunctional 3'-5' exonuclease/DNA polymerase n=1 Tax=Timonella sp. A28 TaxID=3442640 RepID=UPI003EB92068